MVLKLSKQFFFYVKVDYYRHVIIQGDLGTSEKAMDAMLRLYQPTTLTCLKYLP